MSACDLDDPSLVCSVAPTASMTSRVPVRQMKSAGSRNNAS